MSSADTAISFCMCSGVNCVQSSRRDANLNGDSELSKTAVIKKRQKAYLMVSRVVSRKSLIILEGFAAALQA